MAARSATRASTAVRVRAVRSHCIAIARAGCRPTRSAPASSTSTPRTYKRISIWGHTPVGQTILLSSAAPASPTTDGPPRPPHPSKRDEPSVT